MTRFLNTLNGWQRIFIFVVLLAYLPFSFLIALSEVKSEYEYKYSEHEINQKIRGYIKNEKMKILVDIRMQNPFDEYYGKKVPLADLSVPIKNEALLETEFISQENQQKYTATFEGIKDKNNFSNDPETIKLANFIQEVIDQNRLQNKVHTKYLQIFAYFSLVTFLTYFVGFMIGWVYKGFKK